MQKRYNEYRSAIISFEENIKYLGIMTPGRYRGFDTLNPTGALEFNIDHTQTGINQFDATGNPIGKVGIAYTKQGVVVTESEAVGPFTIDTNVGNNSIRYDYIVMRHEYVSAIGGSVATYSLIKGPLNNASFPTLTDPNKQVILGLIKMEPGSSTVASTNYTRQRTPDSGDEPDARINEINHFSKFTTTTKASITGPNFDTGYTGLSLMTLANDGNVFPIIGVGGTLLDGVRILDSSLPEGAQFFLVADSTIGINNNRTLSAAAVAAGYKNFLIPNEFATDTGVIAAAAPGLKKIIEVIFTDNQLYVLNVTNTGLSGEEAKVSAASGDTRPGVLADKLQDSTFIKFTVTTTNSIKRIQASIKNDNASWDNQWRNIPTSGLPSGWAVIGGGASSTAQYKIDFFGTIHLKGIFRYTGNVTSGSDLSATLFNVPDIKQTDEVKFPVAIEFTGTSVDSAPYWYAAIDASGNFKFYLRNMADNSQSFTSVTVHLKGIVLAQ